MLFYFLSKKPSSLIDKFTIPVPVTLLYKEDGKLQLILKIVQTVSIKIMTYINSFNLFHNKVLIGTYY